MVDGMLGKLARWLRILGVKALYYPHAGDEELLAALENKHGIILLTRDRVLHERASRRGLTSFLVPQGPDEDVLAFVLGMLGVEPVFSPEKALCALCGGRMVRVGREEVAGRVPKRVLNTYTEFFVCSGCGQVYWLGTHVTEIEKRLEKVRCILHGKVVC